MTVVAGNDLVFIDLPGRRAADPFAGAGAGESTVRRVSLEPVATRSPHRHPLTEEVVFVAEGRGRVWIEGVFHPVAPGSWVRIPAGAAHATLPASGEHLSLICFFPHPNLDDNLEELDTVLERHEEDEHG